MGHPIELEADVVLEDGSTVRLRPLQSGDAAALSRLLGRLSNDAPHERFLGTEPRGAVVPAAYVSADWDDSFALGAEVRGELRGVARYDRDRTARERAEVSVLVEDAPPGPAIGTRLVERLTEIARAHGVRTFEARVSPGNEPMLQLLRDIGATTVSRRSAGFTAVSIDLSPTPAWRSRTAARALFAASASIGQLLAPRAVAVVGASRRAERIGGAILRNIVAYGFKGRVYAVNPAALSIEGVPSFPRVSSIPGAVDLAVIAVPAARVLEVVDDCAAKGVRGIVVISAGFGECGTEGAALQAKLLERVRAAGMRMIGPNCMGVINAGPSAQLNATFAPVTPMPGNAGFATQSGALGLAILEHARRTGVGLSTFVSLGNKADISGNDLIQYWAEDAGTAVLLLYLESFGNPRVFARIARQVSRRKPIVAVKAGRTRSGARAAASHTGALAASDRAVDGLLRQAGVIRVGTVEELFDCAVLFARQRPPAGRRVGILTNAGGPGILAADACEAAGLVLPDLAAATSSELRSFLPSAAGVGNPVDLLASASPAHYRRAVDLLVRDPGIDSLIVIYIPPLVTDPDAVARAVAAATRDTEKTVLGVFMGAAGAPAAIAHLPCYAFPEPAARALARAADYGVWRSRPEGQVVLPDRFEIGTVRRVIDAARVEPGGGWLAPSAVAELLTAAGVRTPRSAVAHSAAETAAAAARVGFPLVLKAVGPAIVHKTDVGGVLLGLRDVAAVSAAYDDLATRLGGRLHGVLLQEQVPPGVELMLGAVRDPVLGPLIAYGRGGVQAELDRDVCFRVPPLRDVDASDMLDAVRATALLRGFRGSPALDEAAVRDTLHRLSRLIEGAPEIVELDLNPLVVHVHGAVAVDARVRLQAVSASPPSRRIAY